MKKDEIIRVMNELFPDAHCELVYHNLYELLISVMLSAQTTDKSVNLVTPALFEAYPTLKDLSKADPKEVKKYIARLGLANNKANNIVLCAKQVEENFGGEIPSNKKDLITLAGVGEKTANVYRAVGLGENEFPVDTHVLRVSNRLGISKSNNPLVVEKDLVKYFKGKSFSMLHHQFIFFGRYHCTARNPKCNECPLKKYCHY